jgi:hypothetical protein
LRVSAARFLQRGKTGTLGGSIAHVIWENAVKDHLGFVLKCIVFSIIFWASFLFVFKPINAYLTPKDDSSQASSAESQEKLMAKYWAQARLADDIQAKYLEQAKVTDEQQKRFDAQLAKQEQVFQRFDALVRKWEAQATPRK